MAHSYDVIVVGGGHAGAEAACAAARIGVGVVLVTSSIETIGQMSCNPAVGGVAKGTVVREVDAFGGIMGRAADGATIQFRMLNRSKGPAVWSPRAQCDRGLYRRAVRKLLEEQRTLDILQGTVSALLLEGNSVLGIKTQDGRSLLASSVVFTAGTFLRGRIHVGLETRVSAGRAGDPAVVEVAEQLEGLGLAVERFKTGTPPRIDGRSVDFSKLERQDGERPSFRFSHYERVRRPKQMPCWITWTGPELRDVIQRHLKESALYGGALSGRGPRYCPSIEDKIVKFPDAERHQVFLEPEGLDTKELYVNGLSTSLPGEVQRQFLAKVPGLEQARMTRAGYAIEYDYYPPEQLTPWLELKAIRGLFFAGQINGTTGYEEAGAQGLMAGINAARMSRDAEPVILPRDSSYVGVLVDDLVTRGVDEPYRLFTSRSEYRLLLRQDNAMKRLGPLACELGMLGSGERAILERRLVEEDMLTSGARGLVLAPAAVNEYLRECKESQLIEPQLVSELVKRPAVGLRELFECGPEPIPDVAPEAWLSAQIEFKYAGYLARERDAARRLADLAEFHLPGDLPYGEMRSLSTEARQKLERIRPESLAQAGRVPGVSPSDLQNLVLEVMRRGRAVA